MWKEKLKKIIEQKAMYGEKINNGALEREINLFIKKAAEELNVNLPIEYIKVLENINGVEFNGFILYGIDEELLENIPNQNINGLLKFNKLWYENEWQKQYIFLGESNISWYVYDILAKKFYELDNPSGTICEEFSGFGPMVEKIFNDALM